MMGLSVLSAAMTGGGAILGAYLSKRGERRAVQETLDAIEGRTADLVESAKVRWTRRAEICAELYSKLVVALFSLRTFLSPRCITTEESIRSALNPVDTAIGFAGANALFLPPDVKEEVFKMLHIMREIVFATTRVCPPPEGPNEPEHLTQLRANHYKLKEREFKRVQDAGDLSMQMEHIEKAFRQALKLD